MALLFDSKLLAGKLFGAKSGSVETPLLDGLVAYWNLSEESGARADSHSGGFNLAATNNPLAEDGVGAGQRAAAFVAASQQSLSVAMSGGLLLAAAAWEGFLWFNSPGDPVAATAIIDCFHNNSPLNIGGWKINLSTAGRVQLQWQTTSDTNPQTTNSASADVTTPGWYSIRFGNDGANGFVVLNEGTQVTVAGDFKAMSSGKDFEIGRNDVTTDTWLSGRVQAVGLWSRSLTANERTFLRNSGTSARLYDDLSDFHG